MCINADSSLDLLVDFLKTLQQFSDSLQPSDLNFEPTGYECRDAIQVVREHEDFHSFNTKLAQKYQALCLKRGLFAAAPRSRHLLGHPDTFSGIPNPTRM